MGLVRGNRSCPFQTSDLSCYVGASVGGFGSPCSDPGSEFLGVELQVKWHAETSECVDVILVPLPNAHSTPGVQLRGFETVIWRLIMSVDSLK